jgi:hypothetical protein
VKYVAVYKKVSYRPDRDGIDAYHVALFHGRVVNKRVCDNNLGDELRFPLELEKDAYELRYIFQPQRNLVVPEDAKANLSGVRNVGFFPVVFTKLFYAPYRTGDLSLGPDSYYELNQWLDSFKNEERLRFEIDTFYELIIPSHERLAQQFAQIHNVQFDLPQGRKVQLALSAKMLLEFPVIWSHKGIIFREDAFRMVEGLFCWDYFDRSEWGAVT